LRHFITSIYQDFAFSAKAEKAIFHSILL